ncbi:MAG: efflux RND transporter periplasmic adaptor subunit [Ignavibacteria bacterium]|nr:efflux RND transporter periplasmic adaptor subunit [Ignavibacteria bacterium]
MKKTIWILIIAALLGLTVWKLFANKHEVADKTYIKDENAKILVTTDKVAYRNLYEEKKYIGTISANRDNKIASETQGKVVYVGVNDGDFINKGHVIARVDDTMLKLQLESAEIQLEGIMLDVKRYENLSKGDAIPAVQLEKTYIAKKSAEVQIKTLKEQISRTTIIAPFSGVVSMRFFDLGSVLGPGVPLLQLTDVSVLKLNLNIPESELTRFKDGMQTEIFSDVYPEYKYKGTISMVGSKGDDSHNFPVQITIENSKTYPLKSGMFGTVKIGNTLSKTCLSIPVAALVGTIKEPQIYKVENGKAYLKNISLGTATNDFLEVTNGLSEGDAVVIGGQVNLYDGALVNTIN